MREGSDEGKIRDQTLVLPYAFSSETLGIGVGIGGTHSPNAFPQSTYFGTAYLTDNGSWLMLLGGSTLQPAALDRLSISPVVSLGRQSQKRLYLNGNPDFPDEHSGSNESSPDNYIQRDAYEIIANLPVSFTLPAGHFKESGIHTYVTRNGQLQDNPSGATSINPFESGKSSILFRPYFRRMWDDLDIGETLYFELGFEHNNADFIPNPHRGYRFQGLMRYDPEWLPSSTEWMTWESELDAYLPLPETSWARQQTVALAAWISYSPTYDDDAPDQKGKPPYFAGPTLGGLYRLRAYPTYRFHDKAALYYSAEYRLMPEWQPFGGIQLLDPLMIQWWQIVGLLEAGRVSPTINLKTLHSDMKYDVGIGFRGMFGTGIGRIDLVVSDEGLAFVAMFGHSF